MMITADDGCRHGIRDARRRTDHQPPRPPPPAPAHSLSQVVSSSGRSNPTRTTSSAAAGSCSSRPVVLNHRRPAKWMHAAVRLPGPRPATPPLRCPPRRGRSTPPAGRGSSPHRRGRPKLPAAPRKRCPVPPSRRDQGRSARRRRRSRRWRRLSRPQLSRRSPFRLPGCGAPQPARPAAPAIETPANRRRVNQKTTIVAHRAVAPHAARSCVPSPQAGYPSKTDEERRRGAS